MKILLATDGSPCSDAAAAEVARRPWPDGTRVRVIAVVEPPVPLVAAPNLISDDYSAEFERAGRERAGEAVERAALMLGNGAGGLQVSKEVLKGLPKREIVEEAGRWGADLVVVGSHGYRSWERMLLGSVSQSVAMHADCSVLIVRCPDKTTTNVK